MQIAAIMPCRGRAAQTVENVRRLLATAGYEDWQLIFVGGREELGLLGKIAQYGNSMANATVERLTYWQALTHVTVRIDTTHLINLANDLWACDDWLKHAIEDYQARFGQSDGLLGFAGDGWPYQHSCHFLISRALLDRYGGWPVWYSHNFGDRELCARAQADGLYAKSERAWLEHCHPLRGQAPDDAVYQAGRATYHQDEVLFVVRRNAGWPKV